MQLNCRICGRRLGWDDPDGSLSELAVKFLDDDDSGEIEFPEFLKWTGLARRLKNSRTPSIDCAHEIFLQL